MLLSKFGVSKHDKLKNLDYASAGHTGFAQTGGANTFTGSQLVDGADFEHQPAVGDLFKAGLGQDAQISLGANLDQDGVLIKRDVDGGSSYSEAGALLTLQRDVTNVTSEDGRYLEMQNAAGAAQSRLTRGGGAWFGTAASGHSLSEANADVLVGGKLEVDGQTYFDGAVAFLQGTVTYTCSVEMQDSRELYLGNSADSGLVWSKQGQDHLDFFVGQSSRFVAVMDKNDKRSDLGIGNQSNPTIFMFSALDPDTDNGEHAAYTYDGIRLGTMETDRATYNFTIAGSNPLAGASTNQDGGDVLLYAGDHATGGGSEGSVKITNADGSTLMAQFQDSALGFFATTPQTQQAHIVDADGQLADITTKFNTLLADLEGYGLLAAA